MQEQRGEAQRLLGSSCPMVSLKLSSPQRAPVCCELLFGTSQCCAGEINHSWCKCCWLISCSGAGSPVSQQVVQGLDPPQQSSDPPIAVPSAASPVQCSDVDGKAAAVAVLLLKKRRKVCPQWDRSLQAHPGVHSHIMKTVNISQ